MNKEYDELFNQILKAVKQFTSNLDEYSDNIQLQINTTTYAVDLADPEQDLPNCDYYPIMELVRINPSQPAQWLPDETAIDGVASEYLRIQ